MNVALREPGSFRDPSGYVFTHDERVFRTVSREAADDFEAVRATGFLDRLIADDRAVATSGDYEKAVLIDGKRYHHILDPRTGLCADQSISVTVIAADAATAEPPPNKTSAKEAAGAAQTKKKKK